MTVRRLVLAVLVVAVVFAGLAVAGVTGNGDKAKRAASACPGGFTSAQQREGAVARDQRVEKAREETLKGEGDKDPDAGSDPDAGGDLTRM